MPDIENLVQVELNLIIKLKIHAAVNTMSLLFSTEKREHAITKPSFFFKFQTNNFYNQNSLFYFLIQCAKFRAM